MYSFVFPVLLSITATCVTASSETLSKDWSSKFLTRSPTPAMIVASALPKPTNDVAIIHRRQAPPSVPGGDVNEVGPAAPAVPRDPVNPIVLNRQDPNGEPPPDPGAAPFKPDAPLNPAPGALPSNPTDVVMFVTVQWVKTVLGGTSTTWVPQTITQLFLPAISVAPQPGKGEIGMGTLTGRTGITKTIIEVAAAPSKGAEWVKGAGVALGVGLAAVIV